MLRLLGPGTSLCPAQFADWFQRARPDSVPEGVMIDIDTFADECGAWWHAMQPAARGASKSERPDGLTLEDWKAVRVPTRNGFYLVLVALSWWGICLFSDPPQGPGMLKAWETMVDDVAWAVDSWTAAEAIENEDRSSNGSSTVDEEDEDAPPATRKWNGTVSRTRGAQQALHKRQRRR